MSTQINVTVGSGGLSDKARQLQTAARQAQLEKERTINLSAEALDKRVAAQAAKGLSPDGLPLYSAGFKQPEIERRPAANRFGGFSVGHAWVIEPPSQSLYANQALFSTFGSTGLATPTSIVYRFQRDVKLLSGNGSSSNATTVSTASDEPIAAPPILEVSITGYSKLGSFFGPNVGSDFYMGEMQVVTGTKYDAGIAYFCLPAGKGKFVLIQQAWTVYGQSIGTHNFYYSVDRFNGVYSPSETSYFGQDVDFISYSDVTGDPVATYPVPSATGFKTHEIKTGYTFTRKVYLCSNGVMKEIALPPTLQTILLQLYPEPQIVPASGGTNAYRGVTYGRDYYTMIQGLDTVLSSGIRFLLKNSAAQNLLQNITTINVYSPDIFDVLNFYVPYSSSIKPKPTNFNSKLADLSKGGFSVFATGVLSPPFNSNNPKTLYNNGSPLHYAIWPVVDAVPDLRTYDSYYASLGLPTPKSNGPKLQFSESRVSIGDNDGFYGISVYDWDDPAYCIEQLKLLGFTTADLTP